MVPVSLSCSDVSKAAFFACFQVSLHILNGGKTEKRTISLLYYATMIRARALFFFFLALDMSRGWFPCLLLAGCLFFDIK